MELPTKSRWLTPKVIARRLDLSDETVRAWCRAGALRALRVGRQYRIEPDDFEAFLRQHRNDHFEEIAP